MIAKQKRLKLSELLEIERQQGGLACGLPKVHGWIQATLRELPFCPKCNSRMRLPDIRPCLYICDSCGYSTSEHGSIIKQVAQENIIYETWYLFQFVWSTTTILKNNMNIAISNDDQPIHPKKTVWYNTYANIFTQAATASIDYANKIWTYTCTFSAPTAPGRYVRLIGLYAPSYGGGGVDAYTYGHAIVMNSGTKLTSEIYQTNTQTLEIVYKYVFSEAV
jgi:ribosomal protein L37AE/L43A